VWHFNKSNKHHWGKKYLRQSYAALRIDVVKNPLHACYYIKIRSTNPKYVFSSRNFNSIGHRAREFKTGSYVTNKKTEICIWCCQNLGSCICLQMVSKVLSHYIICSLLFIILWCLQFENYSFIELNITVFFLTKWHGKCTRSYQIINVLSK